MRLTTRNKFLTALCASLLFSAKSALACAACAGKSDSDLAKGMNWGIFTLLCVVIVVLGVMGSFFIFLINKSSAHAAAVCADALSQTTQQI